MPELKPTEIFPLRDEKWLSRGQIARADVPKLLPHPDLYGFSKEVREEIAKLVRQGQIIRYDDYTFPRIKRGYALANPEISPEVQAIQESLRSLREGSWVDAPESYARAETRLIEQLAEPEAKLPAVKAEVLPSVVDYDLRYTLLELREMARQEGLSPSGNKKEIARRLIEAG